MRTINNAFVSLYFVSAPSRAGLCATGTTMALPELSSLVGCRLYVDSKVNH